MGNLTHEFVAAQFAAREYQLLSTYESSYKKLDFICPNGHKHSISWGGFRAGQGCGICAGRVVTHDQVKQFFEKENYTLLSQYKNSKAKVDFICPNGHKHSISWNSFNKGTRCALCNGAIVTHDQVEKEFKEAGYALLSKYKNSKERLNFTCNNGHSHSISWNRFSQGSRCAYCAGKIIKHEEVEKAFSDAGYQLLSQYKNSKTKLNFICPSGHKYSISLTHFNRGVRCAYCAGKIVRHEEVEKAFSEAGYKLLSNYNGEKEKLSFVCPKGHRHSISWSRFQSGQRCGICAGKQIMHEQVEKAFNTQSYQLLSKYKGATEKLDFICPKGHKHSISWASFNFGRRCVYCAKAGYTPSKPAHFYYLYFERLKLYKVGITNRTISKRFKRERNEYIVLLDEHYEDGSIPRNKEKNILKMFKQDLYIGDKVLESGNSELFVRDILGLNSKIKPEDSLVDGEIQQQAIVF